MDAKTSVLIFIPTYNESENISLLYRQIRDLLPDTAILVMDDNSPDQTADRIKELMRTDSKLSLVQRSGKQGIGSAHLEAIRLAYEQGYAVLVTMDADLTHPPSYIPSLLNASEQFDIVVGSRYLTHSGHSQLPLIRALISRIYHSLAIVLLNLPYDSSNAFRLYRLSKIPRSIFERSFPSDYAFFLESLFILHRNGIRIGEIPMELHKRVHGQSKMEFKHALNGAQLFFKLLLMRITGKT